MVTSSGPSLRTVSSISPGRSTVRSTANCSTAGPRRSPSPGSSNARNTPMASVIRASGSSANSHTDTRPCSASGGASPVAAGSITSGNLEEPLPAELCELRLVRVEHVAPGVGKLPLKDSPLTLAEHDRIGQLSGLAACARGVVVKQVAVQVKRVDQVELKNVDQIDPHQLLAADADWLVHVGKRDRVRRVEFVGTVEVRVKAVHHH